MTLGQEAEVSGENEVVKNHEHVRNVSWNDDDDIIAKLAIDFGGLPNFNAGHQSKRVNAG